MNLVFLGPPGSGKGTQAKNLAEKFDIPHISLGDMLRIEVGQASTIGLRIKEVMEAGNLVPDEITIALTHQRLKKEDCRTGFILDGFPRNEIQADALDRILAAENLLLDKVVYFQISEDDVVMRLSGRRSCKKCGSVYHLRYNPPKKEGVCDRCGESLYQRPDDEEAAIRTRFLVYAKQTKPLILRYEKEQKLVVVDAGRTIDAVFGDLLSMTGNGHHN